MRELDLLPVCARIVDRLAEVTSDEEVLVLTDPENAPVARALCGAVRAAGASGSLLVAPRTERHGNEPPATVAAAMKETDVLLMATTHSLTHTRARLAASEAGTRVVVLRGVTEDLLVEGGINTDYDRLREVTATVRDAVAAADAARVTGPAGTDVEFSLAGRPAFSLDGFFHDYGFSALPPGEAPTSPVEGSAEGTVVVDYSMDNVGRLDEPIRLEFADGFVQSVSGGAGAARLREILAGADDNAGNLAEFAVGTNPDARLVGNLAEDKKRLGTVHFAVGDNESLGGSLRSDIHLDGVVLDPTVELDGTTLLDGGDLDLEAARSLAD